MSTRLEGSVAVITGASSGIGRATAIAFARQGAHVVLAARRERLLHEVAAVCERAGVRALAVPTDVAVEESVQSLARAAVEAFGRLDVWVNNAAVTAYGAFEDIPPEAFRRVIDTNFFGYVHGARAALAQFRLQGRGTLIFNGSMVSKVSEPFASAYVASKHAVRGLAMSLRQELAVRGPRGVRVCVVMPATIDTPFFQHAGNWAGRAPKAMPPVYPPERVARTMVRMAKRPRREVFVGNAARQFALLSLFAPGLAEKLMAFLVDREHFQNDVPAEPTEGNLFTPMEEGRSASGGWKPRGKRRALRAAVLGGAALLPAGLALRHLQRQGVGAQA